MIEEHTTYSYIINKLENPSFEDIYNIARNNVKKLLREWENDIFKSIDRGTAIISNEPQMFVYMNSYGRMHEAKLKLAFNNINQLVWDCNDICIIDYGCGQGTASMVLIDFLKTKNANGNVKYIKLIEPSVICLKRAHLHLSQFAPNAQVSIINKSLDMLVEDDIKTTAKLTIHLLSNVLDIETISLKDLANNINSSNSILNEIICVGPLHTDQQHKNRMDIFCGYIKIDKVLMIELHKNEWINSWTSQVRICSNIEAEKRNQISPIQSEINTTNKPDINSWSLLAFAQIKGNMQVGSFIDRQSGEKYKACIFTDENNPNTKTFVSFSLALGELSPLQIREMKHELKVVYNDDTYRYSLCKKDE